METGPETIKTVISQYLLKYLEEFRNNLDHAIEEFDPEAIHQYRVSVKRIRAVIRALDRVYDDPLFPEDLIVPLRLMFKAGGTIRDDQVQIGLVENIEKEYGTSFPLIKAYYQKRIEDQKNRFFLKTIDFEHDSIDHILRQIERILEPLDEGYLEETLYLSLRKSMLKLKRKRYDLDQPEMLHRFRTRFKENGYIAEMFFHSKISHKITKSTFGRMKHFGQELGNWHDHYQLRVNTVHIFQESRDPNLIAETVEMRKLITPIHDKLFQEILHLIKRDDSLFTI
jgi:CHAD domain-containing protein